MIVVGIDPGVGESHAVMIRRADGAYHVTLAVRLVTDPDWPHHAIERLTPDFDAGEALEADLIAVEIARGEVYAGRSGDAVLRNNLLAGILVGQHVAAGRQVVTMPPSGRHAGFNWRDELGVRKHTDAGVQEAVTRLLTPTHGTRHLPRGPRGGAITHYWDAAGIALAAHERAHRLGLEPGPDLAERFQSLNALEWAQRDRLARDRATRAAKRSTRRKAGRS